MNTSLHIFFKFLFFILCISFGVFSQTVPSAAGVVSPVTGAANHAANNATHAANYTSDKIGKIDGLLATVESGLKFVESLDITKAIDFPVAIKKEIAGGIWRWV